MGIIYAVAAYTAWGILPLYWKFLSSVSALEILACRITFSLVFVWIILVFRGKKRWYRILWEGKNFRSVAVSATLITINWGIYIWSVNSGHTVEAALGYYINPLVNVLLGLILFKEQLPRLQWIAFAFAAIGVVILTIFSGSIPWISLILAFSFGFYGLAKKKTSLEAMDALGAETLVLTLPSLGLLIFRQIQGAGILSSTPPVLLGLVGAGIITALPLYWFAQGAKRLPLSSLGFIQYIAPTLQLILGVFVFGEAFPKSNIIPFILVWSALVLYSYSLVQTRVASQRKNGV